MNTHGFSERDARLLLHTAKFEPFVKGTKHRAGTVDISVIGRSRSTPTPPPTPEANEKPLDKMTRAELIQKYKEDVGET